MSQVQDTPPGKIPLDHQLWLKEIRNRDLAKKTGISEQNVSRFRRGLRPSPADRKKIARALKLTEADLGWEVSSV